MLSEFRAGAGGFFAKLLLAILVLSFAVWGIEDMLRRPAGSNTVATIGNTSIYIEPYQAAVRRETDMLRRALGAQATPEIMQALEPERRALQGLIEQSLLKQESQAMGIIASDEDVARHIHRNPSFHDVQGKFDKARFETILDRSQLTEKAYVERLRQDLANRIILQAISAAPVLPDGALKTLHETRETQRRATLYVLNEKLVGADAKPKPGELEEYFTKHAVQFTAPEQRSVSYVIFRPEEARGKITVSQEALFSAYQERIDEWKRPERREVDQLLFANEEEAKKASDALAAGKAFDDVAKTAPILNTGNTSLGKVEEEQLLEGAADEVFSLPEKGISKPIESAFGWHLFRVKAIEASSTAPLSEVSAQLEKELKHQLQEDAQTSYINKIEDALASGSTLPEIARDFGLPLQTVGPVSKTGGQAKLPALDKFLDTAFATPEKTESALVSSKGGVYYALRVDSVTPERSRSLDEVRAAVTTDWQKAMRSVKLNELAAAIAQKFTEKKSRASAIAQYRLAPSFNGALKRSSERVGNIPLPQALLDELFSLPAGESTGLHPLPSGEYALVVIGETIPAPPLDAKAADALRDSLTETLRQEVAESYIGYLKQKYPVEVNEKLVAALKGQVD